jgi:integrase
VPSHADKIIRRLERDVFPWIGSEPVGEVTTPKLLTTMRRIEHRGAIETAHRALQNCGQVFRYAAATGRAERDPSGDLRGALSPVTPRHHASITDAKAIGQLLRDIRAYESSFVTRCALLLAPLVFVRPGELRKAEWAEVDLDAAEWRIPAARDEVARYTHRSAVDAGGRRSTRAPRAHRPRRWQIPVRARSVKRPMSENTVNAALRRLGYDKDTMTGHGFRSMASTILNERGWNGDAIERQLAHAERNGVRAAYNYAEHLPERRKMMQAWADHLDSLERDAKVIRLGAA